jgi:hypothetical protein
MHPSTFESEPLLQDRADFASASCFQGQEPRPNDSSCDALTEPGHVEGRELDLRAVIC